jgi:hypothetical protein
MYHFERITMCNTQILRKFYIRGEMNITIVSQQIYAV